MNIKKILALTLVIVFVVTSLVGCRKIGSAESMFSSANSDIDFNYSSVEIIENESNIESTLETSANSTVSGVKNPDNSKNQVLESEQTPSADDGGSSSETVTDLDQSVSEITGSGTSSDPYFEIPDNDTHTVKTVNIPAGTSAFYNISRSSGRVLTINNDNAYVIFDGTRYDAVNGKVSFVVKSDKLASDFNLFEVGNKASSGLNFEIIFSDLQGTQSNPYIISKIGDTVTTNLAAKDETVYYYKYTAEQDGDLHLFINSTNPNGSIQVTNNSNMVCKVTNADDITENTDDTVYVLSLKSVLEDGTILQVTKGDEIIIVITPADKKGRNIPATTVTWYGEYK